MQIKPQGFGCMHMYTNTFITSYVFTIDYGEHNVTESPTCSLEWT